jgi:hypothetical protein
MDVRVSKVISQRIDELRRIRGISVVEFCHALGISRQTYYDHMHGQPWTDDRLEAAAFTLETTAQVLRYGPEASFTEEDRKALEELTGRLLDALGSDVNVVSHNTISKMIAHLYGIHAAGGRVSGQMIDSLVRVTLGK